MGAGPRVIQHPHDAAAVERAGQLVEFGELFDALVGFLELEAAFVERLSQRTGEYPEKHAASDAQDEHQHRREALQIRAVRNRDRFIGQQKQPGKAERHRGPDNCRLPRRRAQRAEVEHDEQSAEKHHADFRHDVSEGQHDRHTDDRLRRDEIMILQARVEARFRQHQMAGDEDETGGGVCRADRRRYGAGVGIDQQHEGIDDVADGDHSLNLTALLRAARQRLRRQLGTRAVQLSRNWIQERGGNGAHGLANSRNLSRQNPKSK